MWRRKLLEAELRRLSWCCEVYFWLGRARKGRQEVMTHFGGNRFYVEVGTHFRSSFSLYAHLCVGFDRGHGRRGFAGRGFSVLAELGGAFL